MCFNRAIRVLGFNCGVSLSQIFGEGAAIFPSRSRPFATEPGGLWCLRRLSRRKDSALVANSCRLPIKAAEIEVVEDQTQK